MAEQIDIDDAALVHGALAGDVTAFGRLVRGHRDNALGVAFAFTGSLDDAEDVVQEALVSAHAKLGQLREPAHFRSWLTTIVRRSAMAWLSRWGRNSIRGEEARAELLAERALRRYIRDEGYGDLWREVWALPEAYREPLLLHYDGALSYREIADMLGVPVTTVKGRLQQSRLKLRERYGAISERPGDFGKGGPAMALICDFDYHEDTERFALMKYDPEGETVTVDIADGEKTLTIGDEFSPQYPHFSPDGSLVAFHGQGEAGILSILVHDIAAGKTSPVYDVEGHSAGFPLWLPDGSGIVCAVLRPHEDDPADRGGRLVRLDPDGSAVQWITGPGALPGDEDTYSQVSPDGRHLAFLRADRSAGNPQDVLCISALGDDRPAEARRASCEAGRQQHAGRSRWSPDSSSLILMETRSEGSLLKALSVPEMEPTWEFEHPDIRGGGFARDGEHVWCVTRDELLWIAYPGGEVEHRIHVRGASSSRHDIPVHDMYDPCVQPIADGPSLLFVRTNWHIWRWQVDASGMSMARESDRPGPATGHEPRREKAPFELADGREITITHGDPARRKDLAVLCLGVRGSVLDHLREARYQTMTATYEGANGIEDVAYDRAVQSACARTCRSLADGRPVAAISMFTMAGDLLDVLGEPTAEFGAAVLIDPDLREKETAEAEALADAVGIPLLIVHTTRSFTSTEKIECVASALRAKDLRCDVMLVDDTDPLHAHRDEVLDRIVAFLDDMNSDDS